MNRIVNALRWLIPRLEEHAPQWQITGGFAAHLYGGRRAVNDIDVDVPRAALERLLPHVREFVVFGPARYRDSTWDLHVVTLDYEGQEIDIAAIEDAWVTNKLTGARDPLDARLDRVEHVDYEGITLRVQNREDLIAYKRKIAYDAHKHLQDIAAIESASR